MTICKVCRKDFEEEFDKKNKTSYKTCKSCRDMKAKPRRKAKSSSTLQDETIEPIESIETLEANTHIENILNAIEIIPNITPPKFYDISDNEDEEGSKPLTINSKLDMIYTLLNNNHNTPTNTEDINLLKSRIDNLELVIQNHIKSTEEMEKNILNCLYKIYCKL